LLSNGKGLFLVLLFSWLTLWSASVTQDVVIWMTGTDKKIWLLDVDFEESFYTWFSTLLLSFAALIAFILASWEAGGSSFFQRRWQIIGIIFLLLSSDEMLSFHERLSGMMSLPFSTSGIFEFSWVIPALFMVTAVAFMFWPFMRQLPYHVARAIFIAGVVFVGGAVGMEMVTGLFISESGAVADAFASPMYRVLTNVEEGFEVLGVILFINALLMQAELRNV